MKNNEIHEANQSDFLKNVSDVLLQAQKNAKTAVNLSMVYAYYEIGRMIVEEEQHGENRATYGKKLLKELSTYLTGMFGKGYSAENLKLMRRFYSIYSHDQIGETVFTQFENLPAISTGRKFYLSWSHYLKLMRIDNIDERHFYEIECVKNDWSLSELKRQYNSALYERLALSTDKDKVYRLALEGQKVETPKDAVKDPYVLEFLGLKELPEYSESELESRIIDHLQQFLLELGTGFAFIGRQVRFTFDEEHFMVDLVFYKADPTATIQFDYKGASGIRKVTKTVGIGFNLYDQSNGMEEYHNNFVVKSIDGRDDSVEFLNGIKIYAGDVIGRVSEEQLRRIQIRETILSHIERERQLYYKGIKVLSLFFIDEVAHYKQYDANGKPSNGIFAEMFEEEYRDIVENLQIGVGETEYFRYLASISAESTHAGYFSIDKKGKMINSKVGRKETTTDDVDAYDLIMKNKELLLDRDPKRSPVRFIFSHSALREGWDNPNVFQICTLKQSGSDVRKRQEVGRGLRLCVNQDGERQDANVLGNDVHNVNILTVIASESYDSFAKGLQSEIAETVADRPRAITADLFVGKVINDSDGREQVVDRDTAYAIMYDLTINRYIDKKGVLTDKYYEDKSNGILQIAEEVNDFAASIVELIDSVYNPRAMQPENARSNNVELRVNEEKFAMPEFQALWSKINAKSIYIVDFDIDELIRNAITSLDAKLRVAKIFFKIESGAMEEIKSKEALECGAAFTKETSAYGTQTRIPVNSSVKYDLVGKLVEETKLTRKDVIAILCGIKKTVFDQFKDNPEEFIIKAAALINEEKATAIIQHITYAALDEHYSMKVFTDSTIKGRLGVNAMKTKKHLYDYLVFDSTNERDFAIGLDMSTDVALYVKLPNGFYISTPVGNYNPDWAIAFYKGKVKHIYFVAETKGSMSSMQLRLIEESKIHCAREHFKAISSGSVVYDVVDSYQSLFNMVTR